MKKLMGYIEQELVVAREEERWITVRRLILTALTFWNARRGNEITRIKISDWLHRSEYLDKKVLTKQDKNMLKKFTVIAFMGKRRRLVQAIVPHKYQSFLDFLCYAQGRAKASINNANVALFAS